MITINDLQQIDLSKIQSENLLKKINELLEGYKNASNKEDFLKKNRFGISGSYKTVQKYFSDAIPNKGTTATKKSEKQSTPKTESKEETLPKKEDTPKKSKSIPKISSEDYQKEIKDATDRLEECRVLIRLENEQKRALQPEKRPLTTYEKVRKKLLSLSKLIPSKYKDNLEVQMETERIILKAHKDILKAWRMNSLIKKEKDQEMIKENFEKIEEKLTTD